MLALRFNTPRFSRSINTNPRSINTNMETLFNELCDGFPGLRQQRPRGGSKAPAMSLWEDADNVYVEAAIPGVANDDVDITVQGNELTVSGSRQADTEEGDVIRRRERVFGSFSKTVGLPKDVDADRIKATLQHGLLLITVPKSEAAKPRKIEINFEK